MDDAVHIVCFNLDDRRYGVRLSKVERVIPAVEITPLPDAPDIVLGVINAQGRVIPVFDVRKRFGLPAQDLELCDQFIIARTVRQTVALWVDAVSGSLVLWDPATTVPGHIGTTPCVEGVVKLESGLVLIHDLDAFLSIDEAVALDHAMHES